MSEGLGGPLHPLVCMLHYPTYFCVLGSVSIHLHPKTEVTTGSAFGSTGLSYIVIFRKVFVTSVVGNGHPLIP